VKVAELIFAINDMARGEVVIDVELLKINTSKLQELGVSLSQYNITQTLAPNPVRVSDLEFINQGNWTLSIPSFIYEFVKNSSEAQLLANPQVRISDGEKATFHIGDRVPIPVTTFNTGQTIGGNIVPITSFQYQEVGIRLDIEPRIHHNKEITLKLKIEVSDISGTVQGSGGQQQPIIGTRNIESTIRLKDGETNFLAGLYQTNESSSSRGFPGLSEIPIIGRLFSRKSTDVKRTDLVLTLTPHIVRTADITEEDLLPIWVGTEANITFRGRSPRVESEIGGPFEDGEEADAERIREMIRRRIQNLPRGVRGRQREDQDEGEVEEIPGVDLVPSSAPIDPFNSDDDDEDDDNGNGSRNSGRASLAISAASEIDSAGGAEPDAESAKAFEARQDPVRLTLRAPQRAISVGEKFVLELHIDSPVPVSHVPLTLQYDPDMLQVESIRAGDFLGSSNESTVLWDYAKPGRIVIGASRLGRSRGVSGRGTLARIEVIALQRGRTEVKFLKSKVMDADLTPLRQVESETVQLLIEPFNRDPDAEDEAN
ncbi:MAG: cohesin domain-containing protein, partial [Thermoanaerobaculia bacterium]